MNPPSDGTGGSVRKLSASFEDDLSTGPVSKKPFLPMNASQFEYDEERCGKLDHPIPDSLKEGDVVAIIRSEEDVTEEIPLYIRQHLVDKLKVVKEMFEDTDLVRLYATGAPGCGKTCFFWMWAIMKLQQNRRLLFIQHRDTPSVWILEDDLLKRLVSPELDAENLSGVVEQLLNQQTRKFDFAILDGVRLNEDSGKVLMSKLKSRTGTAERKRINKSVFVTSLQFSNPLGYENRGFFFNRAVNISFDSWKESDYDRAVQSALVKNKTIRRHLLHDFLILTKPSDEDETLEDSGQDEDDPKKNPGKSDGDESDEMERLKKAVKLKYRYAGGCARFMFEHDINDLKAILDGNLHKLKLADWDEFATTLVAGAASIAVNSLMQRFAIEGRFYCAPVSEYVLRRAYEVCRNKLTQAVMTAAAKTQNPSLLGWAFEMGELDKIDYALDANQLPSQMNLSAIRIDTNQNQLTFCPKFVANYNGKLVNGIVKSGTVIRCDIWNQGCFDVALYIETTLVTLQVTSAKSHSLKLNHVTHLRNTLLQKGTVVDDVVHVAIVKDNLESFRFADATGIGRCMPRRTQRTFGIKVARSTVLKEITVSDGVYICNFDNAVATTVYETE